MSALLPLSSSYSKPLLPSFSHCDLPNCLLPPSFHTQLFLTPGFCLIPHIEAKPYTAMMFHRSQSQMGYMISSTSQPHMEIGAVPILQMMKTEAKKDEITCLKPHSYREAEARWCLVCFFFFPSNFTSHRESNMTTCTFPWIGNKPSLCSRTPENSCFLLRRFSREQQRSISLLETYLELWGSPPLSHWIRLMFKTISIWHCSHR